MAECARRLNFPFWFVTYALVVAASVGLNYPGGLMSDSSSMLVQARYPELLNNWHSPLLPWMWSIFSPPLPQPFGALLVQNLLLFPYPVALLVEKGGNRAFPLVLIILLTGIGGFIGKDCTLVGILLIALGALDFLKGAPRVAVLLIAGLAATLMRPSNFVMLFAVGVLWSFIHFRGRALGLSLLVVGALSIATIPLTGALSKWPYKASEASAEMSLYIFDAAGISVRTNNNVFSSLPNWPRDIEEPSQCYRPNRWDDFGWGPCKRYAAALDSIIRETGKFAVLKWWIGSIAKHPVAYVAHRASYSRTLLMTFNRQLVPGFPLPLNWAGYDNIAPAHTVGKDVKGLFQAWEDRRSAWPLSIPVLFLLSGVSVLAAFLLSACALVRRARSGVGGSVLIVSATLTISSVLMLMVFGVADETRYLQPTLICGFICFYAWVREERRAPEAA